MVLIGKEFYEHLSDGSTRRVAVVAMRIAA